MHVDDSGTADKHALYITSSSPQLSAATCVLDLPLVPIAGRCDHIALEQAQTLQSCCSVSQVLLRTPFASVDLQTSRQPESRWLTVQIISASNVVQPDVL